MNKELQELTFKFATKASLIIMSDQRIASDTMDLITMVNEMLLPIAGSFGGVRSNPDFNLTQKMTYMGNKSVAIAIESFMESDEFESINKLSEGM